MSNIRTVISSLHLHFSDKKFKWLNWGGCAVWATIVAKEFTKRGIEAKIVVASSGAPWQPATLNEIRAKIPASTQRNWTKNNVGFGHVVVEVEFEGKAWYLDSESILPAKGIARCGSHNVPVYKGYIEIEDMAKLASRPYGWNDTYDRSLTPAVRALIKKCMKQLETA